ncbi:hypothetical protein MRX96_017304 [Rhipicephalus microplus]
MVRKQQQRKKYKRDTYCEGLVSHATDAKGRIPRRRADIAVPSAMNVATEDILLESPKEPTLRRRDRSSSAERIGKMKKRFCFV